LAIFISYRAVCGEEIIYLECGKEILIPLAESSREAVDAVGWAGW
jgi:hypothetical protein